MNAADYYRETPCDHLSRRYATEKIGHDAFWHYFACCRCQSNDSLWRMATANEIDPMVPLWAYESLKLPEYHKP